MPSNKPSNGELALMIGNLSQETRTGHQQLLEICARTEAQATNTNGRVRKLEQLKFAMFGGLAIVNIILVPIIISWINGMVNI